MYQWFCSKMPPPLVSVLFMLWYAALLIAVVLMWDRPFVGFYYLGG